MGLSWPALMQFGRFHERGLLPAGGSIIDLGPQEFAAPGQAAALNDFIRGFPGARSLGAEEIADLAANGPAGRVYEACGFRYRSLDMYQGYKGRIFDLNHDRVRRGDLGRYDLVCNIGTTEHVMNQLNAMRAIHEFTKPGGLMWHELPLSGYLEHGFFSYHPLMFDRMGAANGYEVIDFGFGIPPGNQPASEAMQRRGPKEIPGDGAIGVVLRKTRDAPFVVPYDMEDGSGPATPPPPRRAWWRFGF